MGLILYKKPSLGHGMLGFSFPCSIDLSGWGLRKKLKAIDDLTDLSADFEIIDKIIK